MGSFFLQMNSFRFFFFQGDFSKGFYVSCAVLFKPSNCSELMWVHRKKARTRRDDEKVVVAQLLPILRCLSSPVSSLAPAPTRTRLLLRVLHVRAPASFPSTHTHHHHPFPLTTFHFPQLCQLEKKDKEKKENNKRMEYIIMIVGERLKGQSPSYRWIIYRASERASHCHFCVADDMISSLPLSLSHSHKKRLHSFHETFFVPSAQLLHAYYLKFRRWWGGRSGRGEKKLQSQFRRMWHGANADSLKTYRTLYARKGLGGLGNE